MGIIISNQWKDAEDSCRLSVIVNGEAWDIYSYHGAMTSQKKGRYVKDIIPRKGYLQIIVGSYLPTDEILDYIRLSNEFITEALGNYDKGLWDRMELADAIREHTDWLDSMAVELSYTGD